MQPEKSIFPFDLQKIFNSQNQEIDRDDPKYSNYQEKLIKNTPLLFSSDNRILIPENYSRSLLTSVHIWLQHPGMTNLYYTVKDFLRIENIKLKCQEVVENCPNCQLNNKTKYQYGKISGFIFSDTPFDYISSDIVGPFATKDFIDGEFHVKFWFITFTDICTRWSETILLFFTTASHIISAFETAWLSRHPKPSKLLSDNGRQYISSEFSDFLLSKNIIHIKTSVYNPSSNGISESINKGIKIVLLNNKGTELNNLSDLISKRLNFNRNRILGCSPAELLNQYSAFDLGEKGSCRRIEEVVEEIKKKQK